MNNNSQTRYILIGGEWKSANGKAADWQRLMIEEANSQVRILVCLFSRQESRWPEKFDRIKKLFQDNLGHSIVCNLARPDMFIEQISEADVVYLDEGDNVTFEIALGAYKNLSSAFKGKTITGSSAGANILSHAYYTRSLTAIRGGLGVLPIKIMVHYDTQPYPEKQLDWRTIGQALHSYGDTSLPIYSLREHEYVVLGQNGKLIQGTGSLISE